MLLQEINSAIYEVFSRLNTGGINLRPQEIRTSMYHSEFYDMLYRLNLNSRWRTVVQTQTPDLHMKDIEIILRGFAMLINNDRYAPSMVRFLNQFSRDSARNDNAKNEYLEHLFVSFLNSYDKLAAGTIITRVPSAALSWRGGGHFTAAARSLAEAASQSESIVRRGSALTRSAKLSMAAGTQGTTSKANVETRLRRADALLTKL